MTTHNRTTRAALLLLLAASLALCAAALILPAAQQLLAQGRACTVAADRLNVRERPRGGTRIVGQIIRGTAFTVSARTAAADWLWGSNPRVIGWVSAGFLNCPFAVRDLPVNPNLVASRNATLTPVAPVALFATVLPPAAVTETPIAPPALTATPIAPPAVAATPTPAAPAPPASYYSAGVAVMCDPANARVTFEGTVTAGGVPVDGVGVVFKSRLVPGTEPVTAPAITGPSGYYSHIVDGSVREAKSKHLEIWLIDAEGNRISDYANWDTDGQAGTCNYAEIDFFAQ